MTFVIQYRIPDGVWVDFHPLNYTYVPIKSVDEGFEICAKLAKERPSNEFKVIERTVVERVISPPTSIERDVMGDGWGGRPKPPEQCPKCHASMQGEIIPPEYAATYGLHTHYSRQIGVKVAGVYDGVLYWRCPDCGHRWHRFQPGHHLHTLAEVYVNG